MSMDLKDRNLLSPLCQRQKQRLGILVGPVITVKAVNEQAGLAVEIECSDQWFEGFLCRPGIVSTDEGPWDRGFEALLGP